MATEETFQYCMQIYVNKTNTFYLHCLFQTLSIYNFISFFLSLVFSCKDTAYNYENHLGSFNCAHYTFFHHHRKLLFQQPFLHESTCRLSWLVSAFEHTLKSGIVSSVSSCAFSKEEPLEDRQHKLYPGHTSVLSQSFHMFALYIQLHSTHFWCGRRLLDGHAGSAIKVLVAIHYSVLDARNGYIRNVVV